MFLEKIKTEGLAQLSYIIGDGGSAAVIDPRRDCSIYRDIADRKGVQITHIFETHRNEDFVIGSCQLSEMTGATIYHGSGLPFEYGESLAEGDSFDFGAVSLQVIKTPGHTDESVSLTLIDREFSDEPLAVFTGDALFVGDVGRTDFFPNRAEEVAGLLYDSIFEKLLPLGDHVLIYPAHGAGSVCGSGMAAREFSSIGYERKHNPALQVSDRQEFISRKINEKHYYPPYFKQMEKYNLAGPPRLDSLTRPVPLPANKFSTDMDSDMVALDTRSPEAYSGAFIPGSLAIPLDMIPAYAGWFLSYDRPIGLIVQDFSDVEPAVRHLARLGYENIVSYLDEGLHGWEISGRKYDHIPALYAGDLKSRLSQKVPFTLLDVRKEEEVATGRLAGGQNIFVGELPDRVDEISRDKPIVTFCGSGRRAIIAASILKKSGFPEVECCLGSMQACKAIDCPIV